MTACDVFQHLVGLLVFLHFKVVLRRVVLDEHDDLGDDSLKPLNHQHPVRTLISELL